MVKNKHPKRGDVWWVNFDPRIGSEIRKTRPAVVISNDISNAHLDRFQVVPLTSNSDKLYPSESYVVVKKKKGKAMTDQIMTIDQERLAKKETTISPKELLELEKVLRLQLGLK